MPGQRRRREAAWNKVFASADPELKRRLAGECPRYSRRREGAVDAAIAVDKGSRHAQGRAERAGKIRPGAAGDDRRLGRSHQLEPDQWSSRSTVAVGERSGNYVSYGVREFGMCYIANGMALHGG